MKTVMFYYLLARVLFKVGVTGYTHLFSETELPLAVLVALSVVIVMGIAVLVRSFMGRSSKREMGAFFAADAVVIVASMLFIRLSAPIDISQLDTMTVGTVLDVVVNVALAIYAFRKRPYIDMGRTVVKTASDPAVEH